MLPKMRVPGLQVEWKVAIINNLQHRLRIQNEQELK